MKAVTETLDVARSNVAERVKGVRAKRGPQTRQGDLERAAEIRRLVDAGPTYGYRWIARQRQTCLSADEEAWPAAGPPHRAPTAA
jgi:hypothetical protein